MLGPLGLPSQMGPPGRRRPGETIPHSAPVGVSESSSRSKQQAHLFACAPWISFKLRVSVTTVLSPEVVQLCL